MLRRSQWSCLVLILLAPTLVAQEPGSESSRSAVERRLFELEGEASRTTRDPSAPHLVASAFVEMHRAERPVLESAGMRSGETHAQAAWRWIVEALQRDKDYQPARTLALELLLARGEREPTRYERDAVALMQTTSAHEAALSIVLAREARQRSELDSALMLLAAVSATDSLAGLAHLERARTLAMQGDVPEAVAAYWQGLRNIGVVSRAHYTHDVGWLLSTDSLAILNDVPDDALPGWLHRFWRVRDAASAGYEGDRLAEHLRRWAHVHQQYRVPLPGRRIQFRRVEMLFDGMDSCVANNSALYELLAALERPLPGDVRDREPLLDHRAIVYMRHGTPARVVTGAAPVLFQTALIEMSLAQRQQSRGRGAIEGEQRESMRQNESWRYWIEGEWRFVHFRGSHALGLHAPTTISSYLPVKFKDDWRLRAEVDPAYLAVLRIPPKDTPPSCLPAVLTVIAQSRADADLSVSTDSDTPLIPRAWGAVTQAFAVGAGVNASGRALLSYAIPQRALEADTLLDGRVLTRVALRVVAAERGTGRIIEMDSVRRVITEANAGQRDNMTGWLEVALPPGTWDVAVRGQQPGDSLGHFAQHRGVVIPQGTALGMSDIVVGRPGSNPPWLAAGEPFPLNALGAWATGESVDWYAEVWGLPAGTEFRLALTLTPTDASNPRTIRITSTERSAGSFTAIRRQVLLDALPPGQYTLTVRVEAGGEAVERQRGLLIHDGGR
jgi:hypothetical protein